VVSSLADEKKYGFLSESQLPKSNHYEIALPKSELRNWGTTGEFESIRNAKNHCAATAAFNTAYYYKGLYQNSRLFVNNSRKDSFEALHKSIGNGPVLFYKLKRGLSLYALQAGFAFASKPGSSYAHAKACIDNGCMGILLLTAGLADWHYANALGYREYESGERYLKTIDNWHSSQTFYIESKKVIRCYMALIT
jgi:hypothetical protein